MTRTCALRKVTLSGVNLSEHDISAIRPKINSPHGIGLVKSGEPMSLVKNMNKRKKAGTSRSKANSTVSDKAYKDMQKGWPKKKSGKKKA